MAPPDDLASTSHAPIARDEHADWPAQAADQVVETVDKLRDATTGKVITAARAMVYGILLATLGITVAVLLLIFAVRLVTELLVWITPWDWVGVWCTYVLFGLVFTLAGVAAFRKRYPHAA